MIKKTTKPIQISALVLVFLLIVTPVFSQDEQATESAINGDEKKSLQIENLKERLATKVAELKQTSKKAMYGLMKSLSISSITIETNQKDVKLEVTDDITVAQIIKGTRTDLSIEDLDEDDFVVVFGEYDTSLDLLDAKHIFIQSVQPSFFHGQITEIDDTSYTITIITTEDRTLSIDYEKSTKSLSWNKVDGIEKSGFSKLNIKDNIHVLGFPDNEDKDSISATRIVNVGSQNSEEQPPAETTDTAASEDDDNATDQE